MGKYILMADDYVSFKIKKSTLNRIKNLKPFIEIDEHISFNSWSDVVDYLISYRTKEPFDIEKIEI